MKITIITVSYNAAKTIGDTLRSVREQSYQQIEHIVIDGGSTDQTLDIVAAEGTHVAKVVSEKDEGLYDAMNKGLALATGDVVGFLNSDDVFANADVLTAVAQAMVEPSTDACYGDLVYVAPDDTRKVIRYWRSREYERGLFERGWVPAHPTFYARRELYERFGGFDLRLGLAADFDVLLRLIGVHGITTTYIPHVLVRMRLGGASNESLPSVIRQNVDIARAFRKYGWKVGMKPFVFKMMLRISQFVRKPQS